jgi:phosphatidylglycerophosphatase C
MPPASPASPPSGIALFDLDGTLLAWDCQLLFRHFVVRRRPWRALLLPLFLLAAPLHRLLGDQALKRAYFSFLAGMGRDELGAHARDFAAALRPAFYPELLERLEDHRRRGHLLILASASPEFYVKEIGALLGFDLTLGTPVATGATCPLFPRLDNHKGAAKVRRLESALPAPCFAGGKLIRSHGYTDSRADLPMLAICDTATVVNPSAALATVAAANRWDIIRTRRPWRTPTERAWRSLALLTGLGRDPGGLGRASGC